jgi:tetratricopeptide (TPR) repeat protein
MMKYNCTSCGTEFETEESSPRCPSCLRKHGLIPAEEGNGKGKGKGRSKKAGRGDEAGEEGEPAAPKGKRIAMVAAAVVVAAAAVGGAAWWIWGGKEPEEQVLQQADLGRIPAAQLKKTLKSHGLSDIELPFEPTGAVKRWAPALGSSGAGGKEGLQKKARALLDEIGRLRAPKGPFVATRPDRIQGGRLLTAHQIVKKKGSREKIRLPGFSLASLALAAARSRGVKAVMVEIHELTGKKGPADPTGSRGRFGVALFSESYDQQKPDVLIDPVAGKLDNGAEIELLDDLTAAAHYLNHKAQLALSEGSDTSFAMLLAEAAGRLGRRSATVQAGRGLVLLAVGGIQPALSAFQTALAIRDDAVRHYCLAQAYMATRDVRKAMSHLKIATNKDPGYAQAYVEQARVMLAMRRPGKVEELLDRAAQADPDLWDLKVLRAIVKAARGNVAQGIDELQSLYSQRPEDLQTFFSLWQMLLSTGQEARAAALEKQALARLEGHKKQILVQRLGEAKKAFQKLKAQAQAAAGMGTGDATGAGPGGTGGVPPAGVGPGPVPDPSAPSPDMDFELETPGPGRKTPGKGPGGDFKLKY